MACQHCVSTGSRRVDRGRGSRWIRQVGRPRRRRAMAGTEGPPRAPGDVATVACGGPGRRHARWTAGPHAPGRGPPGGVRGRSPDRRRDRAPAGARGRRAGRPICLDRRRARGGPRPGPRLGRVVVPVRAASGPGPVPSPGARRRPGPRHRDATVGRPRRGRRPGLRRVPRTTDGRVRGSAGGPADRAMAGGRARHRPADRAGRPCRRDPRGHPADADGAHRRPLRGLGASRPGTPPPMPAVR